VDDDDAVDDDDVKEPDNDKDGSPASEDCDDEDARRYPGAIELCDGIDNDCDEKTFAPGSGEDGEADLDDDKFLSCADCDDDDQAVNPEAAEVCDGIDNNCDGVLFPALGIAAPGYVVVHSRFSEDLTFAPRTFELRSGDLPTVPGDAGVIAIPDGFDFSFFGEPAPGPWAFHTNGLIEFAGAASTVSEDGGQILPSSDPPHRFLAWWWERLGGDDLAPTVARMDVVDAGADGQILLIDIEDMPHAGNSSTITLQVQLYETGVIEIHFIDAVDDSLSTADLELMTIGVENGEATVAATFANAVIGVSEIETAVRFTPGFASEMDVDGDGELACFDCDDLDPTRNSSEDELCDGIDNDCDGMVDNGADCPCDQTNFNGASYQSCDGPLDWLAAAAACAGNGYTLASILDAAENAHVASAASSLGPHWLGGTDAAAEGTWLWPDDTQFWTGGGSVGYVNWGSPPDNEFLNCLVMGINANDLWSEFACATPWGYTCKAPAP
jgi:hypothetical protein